MPFDSMQCKDFGATTVVLLLVVHSGENFTGVVTRDLAAAISTSDSLL